MGVVLALVAGVPLALYSIYYFAESIRLIAAIILGLLFIVALIGLVFARFKETIVAYVFKQASSSVDDLATPLAEAAKSFGGGDFEVGQKGYLTFSEADLPTSHGCEPGNGLSQLALHCCWGLQAWWGRLF